MGLSLLQINIYIIVIINLLAFLDDAIKVNGSKNMSHLFTCCIFWSAMALDITPAIYCTCVQLHGIGHAPHAASPNLTTHDLFWHVPDCSGTFPSNIDFGKLSDIHADFFAVPQLDRRTGVQNIQKEIVPSCPSIYFLYWLSTFVSQVQQSPADCGQDAGHTLDWSVANRGWRRKNISQSHSHPWAN